MPDPGKILAHLVVTLALGRDCLSDVAALRVVPEMAGPVTSDPAISRLASALAAEGSRALRAIRKARAADRERAWALAGEHAPGGDGALITVDIDATIVTALLGQPTNRATHAITAGSARLADNGAIVRAARRSG